MIAWHAKMADQRRAGATVASIAQEWRYGLPWVTRVLRKQGVPPGQNPRRMGPEVERRAKAMRAAGASWAEIARACGCSRTGARKMVLRP